MDINSIAENYQRKSDIELIGIAEKPSELRLEIIPVLQKELLRRGKQEEALALSDFLIQRNQKNGFAAMTKHQLKEAIQERLDTGESLESIRINLKENGIDIFEVLEQDHKLKEKAFDFMAQLKEDGHTQEAIDEKVQQTLAISKEEHDLLKTQIRQSGKRNLIFGYVLSGISVLGILLSLGLGGSVTIGSALLLCIGLWQIHTGKTRMNA